MQLITNLDGGLVLIVLAMTPTDNHHILEEMHGVWKLRYIPKTALLSSLYTKIKGQLLIFALYSLPLNICNRIV